MALLPKRWPVALMDWRRLVIRSSLQAAQRMPGWRVNLTGALELGTRAALVSQARLLVSNDTEISRMAVALKTPSG